MRVIHRLQPSGCGHTWVMLHSRSGGYVSRSKVWTTAVGDRTVWVMSRRDAHPANVLSSHRRDIECQHLQIKGNHCGLTWPNEFREYTGDLFGQRVRSYRFSLAAFRSNGNWNVCLRANQRPLMVKITKKTSSLPVTPGRVFRPLKPPYASKITCLRSHMMLAASTKELVSKMEVWTSVDNGLQYISSVRQLQ